MVVEGLYNLFKLNEENQKVVDGVMDSIVFLLSVTCAIFIDFSRVSWFEFLAFVIAIYVATIFAAEGFLIKRLFRSIFTLFIWIVFFIFGVFYNQVSDIFYILIFVLVVMIFIGFVLRFIGIVKTRKQKE